MEKLKVLKNLETKRKMFEDYLRQIKTPRGKKGIVAKKAVK